MQAITNITFSFKTLLFDKFQYNIKNSLNKIKLLELIKLFNHY